MIDVGDVATPVTVVGGFLGSGKTTLITDLLKGDHGLKVAVLVNDFGEVNIDQMLVQDYDENVIGLQNGCICCRMNDDLYTSLNEILSRGGSKIDHIFIEASGTSDPGRIMDTVRHARYRGRLRDDGVVVLVDAGNFDQSLALSPNLVRTQLAAADLIVLNKTDLVSDAWIQGWKDRWLSPGARFIATTFSRVPIELLSSAPSGEVETSAFDCAEPHETPTSAVWKSPGIVRLENLNRVLSSLPTTVVRAKGLVRAEGKTVIVHVVGRNVSMSLPPKPATVEESVLVLLGFGLAAGEIEAILADLDACVLH